MLPRRRKQTALGRAASALLSGAIAGIGESCRKMPQVCSHLDPCPRELLLSAMWPCYCMGNRQADSRRWNSRLSVHKMPAAEIARSCQRSPETFLLEERQESVAAAFLHAWNAYKVQRQTIGCSRMPTVKSMVKAVQASGPLLGPRRASTGHAELQQGLRRHHELVRLS